MKAAIYNLIAWFGCFGLLGVHLAVDYRLRLAHGNIHQPGVPEPINSAVYWLLIGSFFILVSLGSSVFRSIWIRVLVVMIEGWAGFALLAYILMYYIVGNGIDT